MEEYKKLRNELVAEGLAKQEEPEEPEKPQRPADAKMPRGKVPEESSAPLPED